jgi:hypothetical protein
MNIMKLALDNARQRINAQLSEHYRKTGQRMADYEVDACIAEDGHTLVLYVSTQGFTAVVGIPDFIGLLERGDEVLH